MSYKHSATEGQRPGRRLAGADHAGTRCLDLLGAGVGLVLLSPLLLALAITVRATSPGPALFRSTRVGRNARPFTLYKYRSMITEAQTVGPAITTADDPRVTRIGSMLRRLKLDELPQLLNVLKGDMSLVGPRPENSAYVARYSREQLAILEAKPGMTSPASLRYRDEETQLTGEEWEEFYVHEVMPAKIAIDVEYLGSRTIWSDIKVVAATIVNIGSPTCI